MKPDILKFFSLQREIFGICPRCAEFFRLSDCKVYLKKRPVQDWMDGLEKEREALSRIEVKIEERRDEIQEEARERGRKRANQIVKRIDRVFAPRRLNADDAKVIFHPIDYVVFCGMKQNDSIKSILLLDRKARTGGHRGLQRSIERVIERGNYDWVTLRIGEDGLVKEE